MTNFADDFVVQVIGVAGEPGVPEHGPGSCAEFDKGVVGGLACGPCARVKVGEMLRATGEDTEEKVVGPAHREAIHEGYE